ncbi:hypothetical protein [uncultured Treponema sp.]|uniref:hypothetical protein n=1 Tax=uncultured Treponema sp. TaxID=162155 RepID=UPI0025E55DB0|nr:hypothetical protein [uncultured Treponema sp.]
MKKLFKTLAALAVVAALGFGFVSCGDPEDDNDGNPGSGAIPTEGIAERFKDVKYSHSSEEEAIAKVENDERETSSYGWSERFIYFYENGTYILFHHDCTYSKFLTAGKVEKSSDKTIVEEKGTYKLTGTFDSGSIEFTATHTVNPFNEKLVEVGTQYSETETIENGKFSTYNRYMGYGNFEKQ